MHFLAYMEDGGIPAAAAWLVGLFVLATGLEKVLAVVRFFQGKKDGHPVPQPLVVQAAEKNVTRDELAKIEKDVKDLETRLEKKVETLGKNLDAIREQMQQNHVAELSAGESRSVLIHERINELYGLLASSGISAALQQARAKDGLGGRK